MKKVMKLAVQDYIGYLVRDYESQAGHSELDKQMSELFKNSVSQGNINSGTMVLVSVRNSPHSIIVAKPFGRFSMGDILRPSKKKQPELDFIFGNILNRKYGNIKWHGV